MIKNHFCYIIFNFLIITNGFGQINGKWADTTSTVWLKDPYNSNSRDNVYRYTKLEMIDSVFQCYMTTSIDSNANQFNGIVKVIKDTLLFYPIGKSYYEQFHFKLIKDQLTFDSYICKSKNNDLSLGTPYSCFGYLFILPPKFKFARTNE